MGAWLIMAVNGVLLGGCCYLVADIVTQIGSEALEPGPIDATPSRVEEPIEPIAAAPSVILDRNLFGAKLTGDTQVVVEVTDPPLVATKLPLQLLGTAAATQVERSRAAILDKKTKKHMVVAVHDRLEGHARVSVTAIERTRVVLDNAGRPEELVLHEDGPKRPAKRNKKSARQARRTPRKPNPKTLNDRLEKISGDDGEGISRILASARIVPHYEDGKMQGMKVNAIKAESVFEKIGLQDGDIITEVNGIVIDRVDATSAIFEEFAEADTIETAVLRGGETLTMSANADELMEAQ
jgi:general secretion pathway protein C